MNINNIFIQLIGLLAWLILFFSYYRKDTNKILIFHIIALVIYSVHYFLLGAYSGLFICIVELICDYLYYKTDKDDYIYVISIPFRILGGIISYKAIIDTLPVIASLIDGYSLTKKKEKVVFGAMIAFIFWIVYDISVGSWTCAITDILVVISNIAIIIYSKNTRKNNNITNNKIIKTITNMKQR